MFESLSGEILSGKYTPGQKLPSEAALVQQFKTSRITVGHALRDLVQRGLVQRIAGSGTYVRQPSAPEGARMFGLLIPDLGATEIFDPICRGIAAAPQAVQHALIWGTVAQEIAPEEQALQLCGQFIERGVAGVFFAPIERTPKAPQTNREILERLEKARIPVVLLDRSVLPYPKRDRYDLVGIDNRRAGFMAAEHLLKLGATGLSFLGYSGSAATVEGRAAGFREALFSFGIPPGRNHVHLLDNISESTIRPIAASKKQGRAFVCANDRTAGELMQVLQHLGYEIPRDVRIVGIDDVEYASLLPVPLTTVHQPCREIGEAAMGAMLDRISRPGMPARDILVDCSLVVRRSCGARSAASPSNR